MAGVPSEKLKNMTCSMSDGKDVRQTSMLDGGAKDSPVFTESNKTVQYKTSGGVPKDGLGAKNDLNQ
jgi:hypothetical protein